MGRQCGRQPREPQACRFIYLTEQDILGNHIFEDGVAYGGWPMDEHTAGGFAAKGKIPSKVRSFEGLYSIPYGCYCSRNIENLMMSGRNISASKLAMGSTRVMGTCAWAVRPLERQRR